MTEAQMIADFLSKNTPSTTLTPMEPDKPTYSTADMLDYTRQVGISIAEHAKAQEKRTQRSKGMPWVHTRKHNISFNLDLDETMRNYG